MTDEYAFAGAARPDQLARFELNDFGNAMRLICLVGGRVEDDGEIDTTNVVLLCVKGLGWLGFNGRFWDREFGDELAQRKAHQVSIRLRGLYKDLQEAHQGATAKEVWKFIDSAGNRGSISAMLSLAQPYLTARIDDFDRHPLAINCRNGTLWMEFDAGRAPGARFRHELRQHDPADRLTRCTAVEYDAEASAPLFGKTVVDSLPVRHERDAFRRMMGYASTGYIHEQAFFFNQGPGQDGKSTVLDACRETMGTYAGVGKPETFLEGMQANASGPQPDIVAMAGDTRFAIVSEPRRGSKLNEGLLKAWTSGSPVSARDLNAKPITFRPTTKLIWEMNGWPVAKGDDDGIWRRLKAVLFRHKVPDDQVDKMLPDKLRGEAAGILNWLRDCVGDWLEHGLAWPDTLKKVTEDYRRSSSPFGDWLGERCIWGEAAKGARTLSGELYTDYKAWAEDQGHDRPMSVRSFGDALRDRQIGLAGKASDGKKFRGPIRLKTSVELAEDVAASERAAAASYVPSGAGGSTSADVPEPGAFDGDDAWGGQ